MMEGGVQGDEREREQLQRYRRKDYNGTGMNLRRSEGTRYTEVQNKEPQRYRND